MLTFKEELAKLDNTEMSILEDTLGGSLTDLSAAMRSTDPYLHAHMRVVYTDVCRLRVDVLHVKADRYEASVSPS